MTGTKVDKKDFGYLIVGNGKLARHICRYLTLLEIPYLNWSRDQSALDFSAKLQRSKRVLLLISDQAVEPFFHGQSGLREKICVHFSGCLIAEGIPSCHSLMTFGSELYDLELYQSIPFICEAEGPGFSELMPGLPNPHTAIPRADKAIYHALCVLSGNFTTLLWRKFFAELKDRWGIPSSLAHPYLKQITQNLIHRPESALTGPLAREDWRTIESNQNALADDPYGEVYASFVKAYLGRDLNSAFSNGEKS